MENNVSEKFAVYTNGGAGAKDALSVVVDTHDQAKAELEKLKAGSACVIVKKSKVENFGGANERIIESSEVECWRKENEADKLSSFQKTADAPLMASGGTQPAPAASVIPTPAPAVKESAFQKKLDSFLKSYSDDGDLMGIGYGFFVAEEKKPEQSAAIISPPAPIATPPIDPTQQQLTPASIKIEGDTGFEIKKLTEEISGLKEKVIELIGEKKDASSDKNKDED